MEKFRREIPNHFDLPTPLSRLGELAYNLWWVWNADDQRVFGMLDPILWETTNHNPVELLRKVDRARLDRAAQNPRYVERYQRALQHFDRHMQRTDTWSDVDCEPLSKDWVAYFSFEFGLHESVPVYAGGLGVLSGDHLKEASELGMNLVGVGFIYNQGYFDQHITEDGWQETRNHFLDFHNMPIISIVDENGQPVKISVTLQDREVWARVWSIQIGRIPLFLLDTNVEENNLADRQLSARLYSNDPEARVSQEILLGIGGVRMLRKLGYAPKAWHMNEGHSAFMVLERMRELIEAGKSFEEAGELVRNSSVFTTHTPVPAGNDQFPVWLVDKYFYQYWPKLGLDRDQFVNLAKQAQPWGETFSMPVLALRFSRYSNGVSKLHGEVSREMWNFLWPEKKVDEVPITSITNGVQNGTFLARRMRELFNKHLGADWYEHLDDPALWDGVDQIPDEELWEVRRHLKRKLMMFANRRIRRQWLAGQIHPVQAIAGGALLEPYSLTIGFARRFATYKRGYLIFRDMERLLRIINHAERPVQIVFAGKAHPADEPGKLIIQQVYRAVKDAKTGGRLIFMENYDMNVARYLVQGVDIWLNTPRRPNEASGTSGMKAAINGALNFSILDGWWAEGYNGMNGWAIGDGKTYTDHNLQDDADAESLYSTLENEIVPMYYSGRVGDNLSSEWIKRVKSSIKTCSWQFSMKRMLKEYANWSYRPILEEED